MQNIVQITQEKLSHLAKGNYQEAWEFCQANEEKERKKLSEIMVKSAEVDVCHG